MPGVDISITAIGSFLASLPQDVLTGAPATHLPTALPLAFPSANHHVNFLSILHLVDVFFSQPEYLAYFAESNSRPADTALRGVLGLYLASDAAWDARNLLSAKAWREGELGENKIAEYFGIEIMREREHESMPGVRVGERYAPAAAVAGDLAKLFEFLGSIIDCACLGEEVVSLLNVAKEKSHGHPEPALAFAQEFCRDSLSLIPSLADYYPDPPGTVLPAAPLRLLQDLAHQFGSSNNEIALPDAKALANISPLPLPLDLLLHLGIIEPESSFPDGNQLRHATGDWWAGKKVALVPAPKNEESANPPKIISLSRAALDALAQASVEACREIASHARFGAVEWQKSLTELDVSRIFAALEGALDAGGLGVRLVLGASRTETDTDMVD